MKVLLVHNHYRSASPSGENLVFADEYRMLVDSGIEVVPYELRNDDIEDSLFHQLAVGVQSTWSSRARHQIGEIVRLHRPTVAHFHNVFPLISPSAYFACNSHDVPVVQTLHNYRLVCPGGLLHRSGSPCQRCVDGTLFNAIIHRCYRGSAAASTAAAASLGFHRILRTFQRRVAAYVVLSQFAKGVMVRGGLPADKIYVRPNFLIDPPDVGHSAREGFLYVGRLSAEKGIGTLLRAWTELSSSPSRPFLHIVGDGPLREIVRAHVEKYGLAAELLPREDRESIMRRMRSSRAVIIPSEWYEGFPLVAVEALAAGAPIIASRLGSLEEIVVNGENGWHFEPGDPRDLVRVVSDVALQDDAENMSRNSRSSFDENYTSEHAFKKLMEIYSAVGAQ